MSFPVPTIAALLPLLLVPLCAGAQEPADSARAEALRDFHGTDLEGKDGPLAKAGLDLLTLYHHYQRADDSDAFETQQSGIRVQNGRVAIDAIAASDVQTLQNDLEALGMEGSASTGRVVSGRFPIEHIPEMARLESLRGALPSQARTHRDDSQPTPSPQLTPSDTTTSPTPDPPKDRPSDSDSNASTSAVVDSGGFGGAFLIALAVLVVVLLDEEIPPVA